MGRKHIATNAIKYITPAAMIGPVGCFDPIVAATTGAASPAILFRRDAIPVPVPRTGAGNTSGV